MSAGRRLVRALEASAAAAGCSVRVTAREQPWSSATFVGARHVLAVDGGPTTAMAQWLARLPEAELVVPGHTVAEIAVRGGRVDALTLES